MERLYRGSVKDLWGPFSETDKDLGAIVFDYSDCFSVFDWGRMPDTIPGKGRALAILAAAVFERLELPESWQEFSKSPEALALRKGNRFGAAFNELGEKLKAQGLKTHYLGVLPGVPQTSGEYSPMRLEKFSQVNSSACAIAVKRVSVSPPVPGSVLGRSVSDYSKTFGASFPKLIPLEVVFRFSCPAGSSLLGRVARDFDYLKNLGAGPATLGEGGVSRWDFPVMELFTKLESTDRVLSLSEGLAISGLPANVLHELFLTTAWVAGILKYWFGNLGFELADGKLEWAVDSNGGIFLADAIGPDELRLMKSGVQFSKEFLRTFYRRTPWYEWVNRAKSEAANQGVSEWKRGVTQAPPTLIAPYRDLASQVYWAITNQFTGRRWFVDAWELDRICSELRELSGATQ